ncbi:WNT3A protein, partial [Polypterus senegalus]
LGTQPILCGSIPGLVPKQLRFCRNYVEIMPSVAEGVKIGIQECQHQFRGRRWNCTTINDSLAIFGPVLDKATRESAFVHAIASAGVAFAVTRSCAEGSATICGCDTRHKGPPGEGWKWGGCSEDAEFGSMVSREFADARENRPDARSAMNRHNNEAGRTSIIDHMHLKCKCHGLSGSCEVKTCWWSQPDFRVIGDYLKDKYDSASEMVVEKHRESRGWVETLRPKYTFFKPPTERDLVYYESSPNFCEPNPETGSFGTRDRICNVTSHGIDGCDLLCCGRDAKHNADAKLEEYFVGTKQPAIDLFRSVRIFDPRQLPLLSKNFADHAQSVPTMMAAADEWQAYLDIASHEVITADITAFWRALEDRLPRLAAHAKVYIALLISSVDVERSFSKYGSVLSPLRYCLSQENLQAYSAVFFNNK